AAAVTLSALAATSTGVAQAIVFQGDYGHGYLDVQCAQQIHRPYFKLDMLTEFGATSASDVGTQSLAAYIDTWHYTSSGWTDLGWSGPWTATNVLHYEWWGGVGYGAWAYKVRYLWYEANGQWASQTQWVPSYQPIQYLTANIPGWYAVGSTTSYCYL